MDSCEVGGTMAGGIPESVVLGDGGVTAEVKGDSPCGTTGGQRSVWSQNMSTGLQYNDSLNIPHSTLTDHYYRLPSVVSV